MIIVTNFEAERVNNVTVDLYADGIKLAEQQTNQLGIALFYLQKSEFYGKEM